MFGGQSGQRPLDAEDMAVSDSLNAYWVAFIRNGDPGKAGGPEWPAFNTEDEARLVVSRTGGMDRHDRLDAARLDWIEARAPID